MRLLILLSFLLAAGISSAQTITVSFDKDPVPNQPEPVGPDYENYLIQNLITYQIDTLKVENNQISIPNNTTTITPFAIARIAPRAVLVFYVEPKKNFTIKMSEPVFAVKSTEGSLVQQEYMDFVIKQEAMQRDNQNLQVLLSAAPSNDSLNRLLNYNQMQMNAQYIEFINFEKDNNLGAYLIHDIAEKNQNLSGADLKSLYDKLSDKGKNTHYGKLLGGRINRLTAMDIGTVAPDFTLKDFSGKSKTLSSLRGKYVLIDFWASWCGPCVKEIPHLKSAYEKYNKKGFEIISVSIDQDKNKWAQALQKYQMPWVSVIDNDNPSEKITQILYYVPTIPRTVLLDKTGKVIGKDFRGEALENKLAELLN